LANSIWRGIIKLPTEGGELVPVPITFNFSKDTAAIIYDNGNTPEVMTYQVEKNTISFKKVSGNVPCDSTTVMVVSYEIKNDQLFLKLIQDACKARAAADASQPFDRVK